MYLLKDIGSKYKRNYLMIKLRMNKYMLLCFLFQVKEKLILLLGILRNLFYLQEKINS